MKASKHHEKVEHKLEKPKTKKVEKAKEMKKEHKGKK